MQGPGERQFDLKVYLPGLVPSYDLPVLPEGLRAQQLRQAEGTDQMPRLVRMPHPIHPDQANHGFECLDEAGERAQQSVLRLN